MPDAVPTIILDVPISAVPDMLERLTAFLLHHRYGFVQTFDPEDARRTAFEIFPAQAQPAVHLTLRGTESMASPPLIHTPEEVTTAAPETAVLLQRLLEVLNPPSGEVQHTEEA